jgi:hypothetical protein
MDGFLGRALQPFEQRGAVEMLSSTPLFKPFRRAELLVLCQSMEMHEFAEVQRRALFS